MADTCTKTYDVGRSRLVSYAFGCGNDDPTTAGSLVYSPFGSTTTKNDGVVVGDVDATTDDSNGFDEAIQTSISQEYTISGLRRPDEAQIAAQEALKDYIVTERLAGRDATGWLRLTDPISNKQLYRYVLFTGYSESDGTNDIISIEFTAKLQATRSTTNPPIQSEVIA